MTANKTITLSENQKAIIERLNHGLYSVEFVQEWINNSDNVIVNAPAALQAMGVKGFYDAVLQIEKDEELMKIIAPSSDNRTLRLKYLGNDSHQRPVYEANDKTLYVDTNPNSWCCPHICTKTRNHFDGEPDTPVAESTRVEFIPDRIVWDINER